MDVFKLSRTWFDFCFENPEKVTPNHAAIYFFAIEHCNRLGWKNKFGFPSQMAMEAVGIKNWRTFIKAFNDLIDWKFIKLIEKSKNQYSANVIAIVENTQANTKALDKALQKHSQKQYKSIASIDIQYNNKQETINNNEVIIKTEADLLNDFCVKYFDVKFINDKSRDMFDKLIRIDEFTSLDIQKAIMLARSVPFWNSNFLSPLKLRDKDPNGVKYIERFLQIVPTQQKITQSDAGNYVAEKLNRLARTGSL